MAFKVLAELGYIPTHHDDEVVAIQVVHITDKQGNSIVRVELRENVSNENYNGPTKKAFVFDTLDDLDDLLTALQGARDEFAAVLQNPPAPEPSAPVRPARREFKPNGYGNRARNNAAPAPARRAQAGRRAPVAQADDDEMAGDAQLAEEQAPRRPVVGRRPKAR